MAADPDRKSTGKLIAIVVVVAVAVALVQSLLLGQSNTAVTGGVVGAIAAVVAVGSLRKKSG